MALIFCAVPVGSSFAAWATSTFLAAPASASVPTHVAIDGERSERDGQDGSTAAAFAPEEEEDRQDEPVAKFERVIDTSQHGKDVEAWERMSIERPVSDVDAECPSPPPRA